MPMFLDSLPPEQDPYYQLLLQCSIAKTLMYKLKCYELPTGTATQFDQKAMNSKIEELHELFFQKSSGYNGPTDNVASMMSHNLLTTAYNNFQANSNEASSEEKPSSAIDSLKEFTGSNQNINSPKLGF